MMYGVLPIKYANYITIFSRDELDFNFAGMLFRIFWLIIALLCYKKLKNIDEKNEIYIFFIMLDLVLNQVGVFSAYADRVAYYYGLAPLIYIIAQLDKGFKDNRFNRITVNVMSVSLLLFYWYVTFVYFNTGETYPYCSDIFKI